MKGKIPRPWLFIALIGFTCNLFSCRLTAQENGQPVHAFSMLTCSPGPDLYSVFGHSAIRYRDTIQGRIVDWVYNYGTFNFDEDFYWKFCTGKLDYMLSKSTFDNFLYEYDMVGRGVVEQPLLLTEDEEWQLLTLLEENYKPENRFYRYDFFYDNCSTRIRDIIQQALGGDVNYSYRGPGNITYRRAIQSYLNDMTWSDFGIDLALGLPCDKVMETGGDMFLPDSLYNELTFALHNGEELTRGENEVLPRRFQSEAHGFFTPIIVFTFLLAIQLYLGFIYLRKNKSWLFTDRLFFFISGLVGVLLVFLWFFTDHTATKWNFNLLWANPVNLVLAFSSLKRGWHRKFVAVYGWILFFLCLSWFLLPQQLHLACIPIVLGLLFTCVKIIRPGMLISVNRTQINSAKL